MTKGRKFEETFRKVMMDFIARKKLVKKHVSEKAWPDDAKADNKMQRIEDGQNITLADSFQIAEALGYDYKDWIKKVIDQFEEEEKLDPPEEFRNFA
jgi:hypothetical protein